MKPATYKMFSSLPNITELPNTPHALFEQINGQHPWKARVPSGYLEYEARVLRKSKVVYFNFALAKEMGLLPKDFSEKLSSDLEKKLVDTFALRIINEYDILNGIQFPKRDIKPNKYMATRYLQLQHSSKSGTTSGDGRSIWNGCFLSPTSGKLWDISSCGTGVTRLSPGSVTGGKPIRTGDTRVSYGSGLADVDEGLTAAILSEAFHSRGLLTERTLVILSTPDGDAINVRAAKNLLRPSHLFLHLKQGNQLQLKAAMDYYIQREMLNGDWQAGLAETAKYDSFLRGIAKQYGNFAAKLEDEYIFCWLEWDGDNMLTAGGIIDYGSIRQFGLCHHAYRYDDVERFSTTLKEQKNKAKYLVQSFVQLIDFVRSGDKKDMRSFSNSEYLKEFERSFHKSKKNALLKRVGFDPKQVSPMNAKQRSIFQTFKKDLEYFEHALSPRGMRKTPDGENCAALFDVRNLLRELPKRYLLNEQLLNSQQFMELLRTDSCTKKMMQNHGAYKFRVERFQRNYLALIRATLSNHTESSMRKRLLEITMRASQVNRVGFVTGDGIIHVVDELLKQRKKLTRQEFFRVVDFFIAAQSGNKRKPRLSKASQKVAAKLFQIIAENQHSI